MQTFLFDFSIANSFIEREHQKRYEIKNLQYYRVFNREPENIEKGTDFILNSDLVIDDNIPDDFKPRIDAGSRLFWVTIVAKEPIELVSETTLASNRGMPTNVYVYVAPLYIMYKPQQGVFSLRVGRAPSMTNYNCFTIADLYNVSQDPKVISININNYAPFNYNIYTYIEEGVTYYQFYPVLTETGAPYQIDITELNNGRYLFKIKNFYEDDIPKYSFNPNIKLDSGPNYNNLKDIKYESKLLTSEYSPIILQYGGNKINLDKTDFDADNAKIGNIPTFSIRNTSTIVPINYKNENQNFSYAIKLDSANNELPIRQDAWLSYLSANKNSLTTGLTTTAITGVLGTGASILTGGPFGIVNAIRTGVDTANKIAGTIAQIHDLKETPDEISKPNLDIVEDYVNEGGKIHIKFLQIREEFMQKAYEYFYHYGYACRSFKIPNLKSRYYFNFIKIIDANLLTNIDNEYVTEIKNILEKGITFWHYRLASTWKGIENYEYENAEVNGG